MTVEAVVRVSPAKHVLIYGIGTAVTTLAGLAVVPILARELTPSDYGVLEFASRGIEIALMIVFMGLRQAFIRLFYDSPEIEWRRRVTGTFLSFVLGSTSLVCCVVACTVWIAKPAPFASVSATAVVLLGLAWLVCEAVANVTTTFLQATLRSSVFVAAVSTRALLLVLLAYLLVTERGAGLTGALLAQVGAAAVVAIIGFVILGIWSRLKFDKGVFREMVRFGLPYFPAALFMYAVANADRYFVGLSLSMSDLGVYALACKFGALTGVVVSEPFLRAWTPYAFAIHSSEGASRTLGLAFQAFAMALLWAALGATAFSQQIIPLVSHPEFHRASEVVGLIALSAAVYSLHQAADIGIVLSKKTKHKPTIFGLAAVAAVVSSAVLVPIFGIIGAGIALNIAMGTVLWFTHHYSRRYFSLCVDWARILRATLMTCAMMFGATYIGRNLPWWNGLILSTLLVTLWPIAMALCGCISRNDVSEFLSTFVRKRESAGGDRS